MLFEIPGVQMKYPDPKETKKYRDALEDAYELNEAFVLLEQVTFKIKTRKKTCPEAYKEVIKFKKFLETCIKEALNDFDVHSAKAFAKPRKKKYGNG
jgi:hypothetical protein